MLRFTFSSNWWFLSQMPNTGKMAQVQYDEKNKKIFYFYRKIEGTPACVFRYTTIRKQTLKYKVQEICQMIWMNFNDGKTSTSCWLSLDWLQWIVLSLSLFLGGGMFPHTVQWKLVTHTNLSQIQSSFSTMRTDRTTKVCDHFLCLWGMCVNKKK